MLVGVGTVGQKVGEQDHSLRTGRKTYVGTERQFDSQSSDGVEVG